jgi:hypothetical protein
MKLWKVVAKQSADVQGWNLFSDSITRDVITTSFSFYSALLTTIKPNEPAGHCCPIEFSRLLGIDFLKQVKYNSRTIARFLIDETIRL